MQYAFQYVGNNRSVKAVGWHGNPSYVVGVGSISTEQSRFPPFPADRGIGEHKPELSILHAESDVDDSAFFYLLYWVTQFWRLYTKSDN